MSDELKQALAEWRRCWNDFIGFWCHDQLLVPDRDCTTLGADLRAAEYKLDAALKKEVQDE